MEDTFRYVNFRVGVLRGAIHNLLLVARFVLLFKIQNPSGCLPFALPVATEIWVVAAILLGVVLRSG